MSPTKRQPTRGTIALNPVTVVVKESILMSSSMRKLSKYSQSGVAAILGGGANDLFSDSNDLNRYGLSGNSNGSSNTQVNDPLLSGFIQLRLMLTNKTDLSDIDSLTLLQPFLLVIKSSSTTGNITSLALHSLTKFLNYKIISKDSKNVTFTLNHIMHSLTHCRFEASEQTSDDAVLLKVLKLLESIIDSDLGDLLSDDVIYEVVQTSFSLACNKRRSDVLRRAAELSVYRITVKIFKRLDDLSPEENDVIAEETHDYSRAELVETIGTNEDGNVAKKSFEVPNSVDQPFGLPAIKQFLGILISMISPENQFKHTESTKVFALSLISTSVEMSADRFSQFPTLLNLIADPIFKHTLQIIQNVNSLPVLQAAMQLFTTLVLTLGDQLQPQVELALTSIISCIAPPVETKKNAGSKSGKSTPVEANVKSQSSKELMVDELSILWSRSPTLFIDLFANYDCDFNRQDVATLLIEFLAKFSLPESSLITSESVPPVCLDGLLTFINNVHGHVRAAPGFNNDTQSDLIMNKEKKKEFITATSIFNNKPKDGIKALHDKGFIKSLDDTKELARFFFEKSSRLNKKMLGEYLAKATSKDLLLDFIHLFEFKGLRVDEALRMILKTFRLPGESQQIERIMEIFSAWYVECQGYEHKYATKEGEPIRDSTPDSTEATSDDGLEPVEPHADAVFVLSYSIIMLNTDLYNPVIKEHMTIESYKRNLKGVYRNNKDFPSWYLEKIFQSIAEKEIVMPEEHHGSSQWFGDAWNNMMAANASLVPSHFDPSGFHADVVLQLEYYIFNASFPKIVDTIFKIFEVAADDHVTARMISTLDNLSQITSFFSLHKYTDAIVSKLCRLTSLTEATKSNSGDSSKTPLSLTRIKVENGETIDVSECSVQFGGNFKAQLAVVVLFRIVKSNLSHLKESWTLIVKILITLLQNGLIAPDIFADFQRENKLYGICKIKPEVVLSRSTATKGLFSTFASYLKGDDEPTDEEVKLTLSALDCIRSANVFELLEDVRQLGEDGIDLVPIFLEHLPAERKEATEKHFETQLLFVVEACVNLIVVDQPSSSFRVTLVEKINGYISNKKNYSLKSDFILRLVTYKLILFHLADSIQNELIIESVDQLFELSGDRKLFDKKIPQILKHLSALGEEGSASSALLNHETYWKLLRGIASISDHTNSVLGFAEAVTTSKSINHKNFMWLLGLLDEISAVGSIGAQWEQEYDILIKTGHKVEKENPYQEIVQTSLRSIKFTSGLLEVDRVFTKDETYALIQALAHQCLNPCQQIRSYALGALENTILQIKTGEDVKAQGIFEFGLFPLLSEDIAKLEIFQLISKVYLHFYELDEADNEIFLKILDTFNQYLEDSDIEAELQKLIGMKKALEKQGETTPEPEKGIEKNGAVNDLVKESQADETIKESIGDENENENNNGHIKEDGVDVEAEDEVD